MANWKLYTEDALAHRYGSTQVAADTNSALAPRVVAVNPASLWTSGTGIGQTIYFDMGDDRALAAIGIANHNLPDTVSVNIYSGLSFGDGLTLLKSAFLSPGVDTVIDCAFTVRYLTIVFNASIDQHTIGAICALTVAGMIEVAPKNAPLFGNVAHVPGYSDLPTAGGVSIRQVTSATRITEDLIIPGADTASGETGADIIERYEATNGFASGLWLTRYDYGADTAGQGPGLYCEVTPGTGLSHPRGPVAQQATVQLSVTELSRGPR